VRNEWQIALDQTALNPRQGLLLPARPRWAACTLAELCCRQVGRLVYRLAKYLGVVPNDGKL